MRTFGTKILAVALLIGFALPANAGILLEPYAGYSVGTVQTTVPDGFGGGSLKAAYSGVTYGGRVGYQFLMLFAALDVSAGSGKSKVSDNSTTVFSSSDSDIVSGSMGLVAGVRIPFFRAYMGYMTSQTLTVKDSGGDGVYKGTGLKLGATYSGLPFIALNFEMINDTYNKLESGGQTYDIGGDLSPVGSAKGSTYMLSVSVPFDF